MYNAGGYVAYIAIPIAAEDDAEAFISAAKAAHKLHGEVRKLYSDRGGRANVGGVELGGITVDIVSSTEKVEETND